MRSGVRIFSPEGPSGSATPTSAGSGTAVGAANSASSAADTAETSSSKFQLPGTKLSVLPIGLGVFAGISVIALIVVGLVTYERTKYRRVSIHCSSLWTGVDLAIGVQAAQARRIGGVDGVWWNGVSPHARAASSWQRPPNY